MIPRPVSVVASGGTFTLHPGTVLDAPAPLLAEAAWLRATLGPPTGCFLPPGTADSDAVALRLDAALGPEAYRVVVTPSAVTVTGGDPAGVHYGLQTLRQLLPPAALRRAPVAGGPWTLPAVEVADGPRFRWRGCMLDVARHFMPVAGVLRLIDLLALHKLNVLHLHLTDDQGWRLEIPAYPRLTTVGAWRPRSMRGSRIHDEYDDRPHGGYYTADDIREIVAYAAARHVTVVPEIDLPGHVQAALAAYPRLGNGSSPAVREAWGISAHTLNVSDEAVDFCRTVLHTVCDLFPSPVIGIGGDECDREEWRTSPAAVERARALGIDPDDLQAWFVAQFAAVLASRGRRPYGWDEILEGGAPAGALIGAWRGPEAAAFAANAGHDVVSCPDMKVYLDYRQSDDPAEPAPVGTRLTVEDVYAFEPVPPGVADPARIIGAQANIWTEHMPDARAVDYMAFPRLCALAEVVWSAPERDGDDFARRLTGHYPRLDALGVEYRRPEGPLPWQSRPSARGNPLTDDERREVIAGLTARLLGRA
ncbi:beta-N-acetylhexosaminidase [Catenuloplanes atrovinosus]|uniref:beta-N-acetylhexosaminidase n=1 Tax=Catenuloplanes atrovinosus TaxID=137266 RepID=A0AAE4CCD2_9ACTN|nr:beta-N-acetylhexosaminidase [Catenuloplanes atrovinosus]MDR7279058.1 hexosaminidase [Catenuloplanes atrovinosus]